MFSKHLLSLNCKTVLYKICDNFCKTKFNLNIVLTESRFKRLVHSTNTVEVDYLISKYKLSKISNGSYGQKSSLHHFNTIDDFNFESEKDLTIDALKTLLDIRKSDANLLVKNYPNLLETTSEGLERHMKSLSEMSMTLDHVLSCPWILYLPLNFIVERLKPFGRRVVTNDELVLLLLPLKTYENVVKKIKRNNFRQNLFEDFHKKQILFTSYLNIINEEFCDLFHENGFIFYYEFERLQTIMSLLMSAGIEPDLICSDLKVFTHNLELMKERINRCVEHKMPVKTWMLRSTEEAFEVCLLRHVENKRVLKDYDNNIEYMANQLNCDKKVIHSMGRRYPRIIRISAKKLFQKLTFLFNKGFTSFHIVDTPKILYHSVDTIEERVRKLKTINIKPNSLKILTLSEEEFQKLFQQLSGWENSGNNS